MTTQTASKQDAARQLKAWARPAAGRLRLAILAGVVDTLAAIGFALSFASAIAALAGGEAAWLHLAFAVACILLRAGAGWLRTTMAEIAGQILVATARNAIADAASRTGPRRFDGAGDGERTAQIVDRSALLAGHAAQWLPGRAAAVLTPVIVLVAVFTQSWLAGSLILASTLMLPVFIWLTASETAALARAQQSSLDALSGVFESRVRMAGTIRAFNGVGREATRVETAARELARRTMAILRVAFLSTAVLEFFSSLSIALVAVYVGFKLLGVFPFETGESLTLREGLAALMLAPEFFAPIRQLSALHHARSDAAASAATLAPLAETDDIAATTALPPLLSAPVIEWKAATLSRGGTAVLQRIEARAEPGNITLLWGPSGCGKTSMLMSLLALADIEDGHICIDGDDVPARHSLVRSAAWVGQRPWAIEGSVRDNLRLGAPDADDQTLRQALDAAGGLGTLDTTHDGLDTQIGPGGSGLSGGELQRLALARAVASGARVLLLDEPTAHLDAEREAQVLDTIRSLRQGRTIILASHSDAARNIADHVVTFPESAA